MDKTIIAESLIHGLGVFATQDIAKNQFLAPYNGEELSLKEFKERYGNDISHTYVLRRQNKIISGKNTYNLSHYCNESLTPNVILKKRALYTLRPVKNGEELFLQYPKNYPRNYVL